NALLKLEIDRIFEPNESEISDLRFENMITIETKNEHYQMEIANKKDELYARVTANPLNDQKEFVIDGQGKPDELKKVEQALSSRERVIKFNQKRSRWIYKLAYSPATKIKELAK
ncbi:MAG: hypothetical protein HQK53_17970, partial [Oligoflexia bacterium]|nr:hypothetical protein [Oligoflexia bacterium]